MMIALEGIAALVVLSFVIFVIVMIIWRPKKGQTVLKRSLDEGYAQVDQVGELIELYFIMALKHGPSSQEAQSFKFGVENRDLLEQKDALRAFNVVVKRFEEAHSQISQGQAFKQEADRIVKERQGRR